MEIFDNLYESQLPENLVELPPSTILVSVLFHQNLSFFTFDKKLITLAINLDFFSVYSDSWFFDVFINHEA